MAFSGLAEAMWGSARCRRQTCLQESSLAGGGGGRVLAADIWRIRKRGVRLPGCWQVLLAWGQVMLTISWPLWLPWGLIFPTLCS